MALNSLNGLSLALIAQETLPVLQAATPMFNLISTDLSAEVGQVGASIATRYAAPMSATEYSRTNGYASGNCTSSVATCTLDQHYHVTVGFTDAEVANIGLSKLQSTFIQPAVYGIVNTVQSALYALIDSTFPLVYSASYQNFGFTGLTTATKILDNSGSNAPRAAFLGTNVYYDILDDLKAVSVVGANELIRQGNIGDIAGVKVMLAPTSTFDGTGLAGFVCGKDALVLAARVPGLAGAPGVEVQNVTDPTSGFTLQLRQWYSPDEGLHKISAVSIFGVTTGNPGSGVRVWTTD